jgi:hypothetical protein
MEGSESVPNQNSGRPKKACMVSLRHKLTNYYRRECAEEASPDRRWLNGFMAAGFHSGLITLKELKLENLSSYRESHGRRMTEAEELYLERRLTKLCEQK